MSIFLQKPWFWGQVSVLDLFHNMPFVDHCPKRPGEGDWDGVSGRQNGNGPHPCFLCCSFFLLFYSFAPAHFPPLLFACNESHFSCFISAFFSYLSCSFLHHCSAVSFLYPGQFIDLSLDWSWLYLWLQLRSGTTCGLWLVSAASFWLSWFSSCVLWATVGLRRWLFSWTERYRKQMSHQVGVARGTQRYSPLFQDLDEFWHYCPWGQLLKDFRIWHADSIMYHLYFWKSKWQTVMHRVSEYNWNNHIRLSWSSRIGLQCWYKCCYTGMKHFLFSK